MARACRNRTYPRSTLLTTVLKTAEHTSHSSAPIATYIIPYVAKKTTKYITCSKRIKILRQKAHQKAKHKYPPKVGYFFAQNREKLTEISIYT